MRVLLGVLLFLGALVLGFYVGLYLMFVGGILSIVDGATADPVNASAIAWGAVKIMFSALAGVVAFVIVMLPAAALLWNNNAIKRSARWNRRSRLW